MTEPNLPPNFTPGRYDVICNAMGKRVKTHEGNLRYHQFVEKESILYRNATSKQQKSSIVCKIIRLIREPGGRFVKFQDGRWQDIGDNAARKRATQTLREINHNLYRSSAQAKRKIRKELNEKQNDRVSLVMSRNQTIALEMRKLQNTIAQQEQGESAMDCDDDSHLELAMTNANIRILASLKADNLLETEGGTTSAAKNKI